MKSWQEVFLELPNGLGRLVFKRKIAHPFLAEYDRRVIAANKEGKSVVFELPPNTGGNTRIKVYVRGSVVWLHDMNDKDNAYVVDMKKLTFKIRGKTEKMHSWSLPSGGIAYLGPMSPSVQIPKDAKLLGIICAEGKASRLTFVEEPSFSSEPRRPRPTE